MADRLPEPSHFAFELCERLQEWLPDGRAGDLVDALAMTVGVALQGCPEDQLELALKRVLHGIGTGRKAALEKRLERLN